MVTHEMRMIYVLQELNVRKDPFWSAECHTVQDFFLKKRWLEDMNTQGLLASSGGRSREEMKC